MIPEVEKAKTDKEIRKLAEAHWEYTERIILYQLELMHFLYVEAMIHGFKHGQRIGK